MTALDALQDLAVSRFAHAVASGELTVAESWAELAFAFQESPSRSAQGRDEVQLAATDLMFLDGPLPPGVGSHRELNRPNQQAAGPSRSGHCLSADEEGPE